MDLKDQFVCLAAKLVGVPYVWGGSTPDTGLDCSGLMVWLLQQTGQVAADFDTTAQGLYKKYGIKTPDGIMTGVGIQRVPQPGDFIFYGQSPSQITHVMLALNADWCIGATNGDHTTTTKEIAIQQDAAVKVKRINYRRDFVAVGSVL